MELGVADREHFIDQQHIGFGLHGHREAKAHEHARGICGNRLVEEIAEFGELLDGRQARDNVALTQADHQT